jgi:hypothetical protein
VATDQDLFKFLDVLVWVEATIYQLDEENENLTMQGQRNVQRLAEGVSGRRARSASPGAEGGGGGEGGRGRGGTRRRGAGGVHPPR